MICLVDERISKKCERALLLRGFQLIKMPREEKLSEAVCSHPDMLVFTDGVTVIASADYAERYPYVFTDIREMSHCEKMTLTSDVFEAKYPNDAVFNALIAPPYIYYKEDSVSYAVKEYARAIGLLPVPVKQGYPACTTLLFGNSAITADNGMKRALEEHGVKVTLISNGDISLPPHEYGFIGGASGVLDKCVYFLGDIDTHRDSEIIKGAIKAAGFTYVSLSDEPLCDLGRIVFIK